MVVGGVVQHILCTKWGHRAGLKAVVWGSCGNAGKPHPDDVQCWDEEMLERAGSGCFLLSYCEGVHQGPITWAWEGLEQHWAPWVGQETRKK